MEASLSSARIAPKGRLKVNLPTAMAKWIVIPALLSNRHPPKKLKIFIDWLAALYALNPVLQCKTL